MDRSVERSVLSLKRDPQFGVDSRWSWVTTAFASWVLLLAMLGQQVAGVIFCGVVDTYGVSRQLAAWPLVLSGSLISLGGPLFGILCRCFSCRAVLLVCPFVAAVSLCACCFADGIVFLIIVFGIIHGLSVSGAYVAVNVLVSQHFEKRRTTACGLVFAFGALGLFATPLAELVRATYGIRGTFLLLGGLTLNAFPATIVLRSPAWMERSAQPQTARKQSQPATDEVLWLSVRKGEEGCQRFSAVVRGFGTVSFAVDAVSFAVVLLGLTTFLLLSVDIATDRGVEPSRAVLLQNAFAVGDILLRLLSGLIIDSRLVTMETVMLLGYLVQTIGFELLVSFRTFPMMLASSALIGASNGSRISLQAPLLVKDFGIDSLPVMMGGLVFFSGVALLTRPLLVGYYRDHHGSYDGLLHVMAALNAALFLIWIIRSLMIRRKRSRKHLTMNGIGDVSLT